MNEELKKYIQDAQMAGSRSEDIRKALVDSGWTENVVDEVLRDIKGATAPMVVSPEGKLHPTSSKMTLALGLIVIAVMAIGAGMFIVLTKNQGPRVTPDLVSPQPGQSPVVTAQPQPTPPANQVVASQEKTVKDDAIETEAARPTPARSESGETVTYEGITFAKFGTAYQSAKDPFVVGGKIGYWARKNDKEIIVHDGNEYGAQYYRIFKPTDVNGKLAFVAAENLRYRQHYLYFDGQVTKLPQEYWGPAKLYAVGSKPAYAITLKDQTTDAVVVGGQEIGRYPHVISVAWTTEPALVDINGKVGFISRVKIGESKWQDVVYLDGKEIGRYDDYRLSYLVGTENRPKPTPTPTLRQPAARDGSQPAVFAFNGQDYALPYGGLAYRKNYDGTGGSHEPITAAKPLYILRQKLNIRWYDPSPEGTFIHGDREPRCGWHDDVLDATTDASGKLYQLVKDGEQVTVLDGGCNISFTGPKPWPRGRRHSLIRFIGGKLVIRAADKIMFVDGKSSAVTGNYYADVSDPVDINGKVAFLLNDSEDGYDKQFIIYDGKEYGRQYGAATRPFEFQGQLGYLADGRQRISNRPLPWDNFIVAGGKTIGLANAAIIDDPVIINGQLTYLAAEKINPASDSLEGNLKFSIVQGDRKIFENTNYLGIFSLKKIGDKPAFMAQVAERKFSDEGNFEQDEKFIAVYDGKEYGREFETVTGFSALDGKLVFGARDQRQTGLGLYPRYFFVLDGQEYGPKTEGTSYEISKDSPISINGKLAYRIRFGNPYADTNPEYIIYDGKKIASSTFIEDLIDANGKLAFETRLGGEEIILLEQ